MTSALALGQDRPPAAALLQLRLSVRAVLTLAIVASVTANVLHAQDTLVGRAIAAWPPLALLLTVELISRVPVHGRRLAAARLAATTGIAGIAAWVSYWHRVQVAITHGESTGSAHLVPLSVDGLVVVASICLVEIGARLHALASEGQPREDLAAPGQRPDPPDEAEGQPQRDVPAAAALRGQRDVGAEDAEDHGDQQAGERVAARRSRTGRRTSQTNSTRAAVERLQRRNRNLTAADIAARLDIHPSTVRRHLNARPPRIEQATDEHAEARTAPRSQSRTAARTAAAARTGTSSTTRTAASTDTSTTRASDDAPAA